MRNLTPLWLLKLRMNRKARTLAPLYPWHPTDLQRRQAAEAAGHGLAALIAWIERDEDVDARCQRRAAASDIVRCGSHEQAIGPMTECEPCESEGELDSLGQYTAMLAEQSRIEAQGAPSKVAVYLAWRRNPPTVCQPCHGLGYLSAGPESGDAAPDPHTEVAEVVCVDELAQFTGSETRFGKTVLPIADLLAAARRRT